MGLVVQVLLAGPVGPAVSAGPVAPCIGISTIRSLVNYEILPSDFLIPFGEFHILNELEIQISQEKL